MNFFKNRIVIAVFSFCVGVAAVLAYQWIWRPYRSFQRMGALNHDRMMNPRGEGFFKDFFGEDFDDMDASMDEAMRVMREQMRQGHPMKNFAFNSGGVGDVQIREDENNYYYEIDLHEKKPKDFRVSIENGQMTIAGQFETVDEESNSSTVMSMSFHRSFPVPEDADAEKYNMEQLGEKLVITVPKVKI